MAKNRHFLHRIANTYAETIIYTKPLRGKLINKGYFQIVTDSMVLIFGTFKDYPVDVTLIREARTRFKEDKNFRVMFLKLRNALLLKKITIGQYVDYVRQVLHRAKKIHQIKLVVKRLVKELNEMERLEKKTEAKLLSNGQKKHLVKKGRRKQKGKSKFKKLKFTKSAKDSGKKLVKKKPEKKKPKVEKHAGKKNKKGRR